MNSIEAEHWGNEDGVDDVGHFKILIGQCEDKYISLLRSEWPTLIIAKTQFSNIYYGEDWDECSSSSFSSACKYTMTSTAIAIGSILTATSSYLLRRRISKSWITHSSIKSKQFTNDQTIIITGGNSGLGFGKSVFVLFSSCEFVCSMWSQ